VFVAGALGAAAAGLRALQMRHTRLTTARAAWSRPTARIAQGLMARDWATAAIDVSDGLAQDAEHLAASSGVGIDLSRAALEPFTFALATEARELSADPWEWVLRGGEDYALLVTAAGDARAGFVRIGGVVEGKGITLDGAPVAAVGHDHFR
jgi:thiamine-monophosphate kinase